MIDLTKYDCEQAFSRLDDFLDRELTADEMVLVREHLALCSVCAMEFDFEAGVLQTLKDKLARIDVSEDLRDKIMRAIRDA
jgi:anti-sigma factor (TIGR02949 family)